MKNAIHDSFWLNIPSPECLTNLQTKRLIVETRTLNNVVLKTFVLLSFLYSVSPNYCYFNLCFVLNEVLLNIAGSKLSGIDYEGGLTNAK